MAGLILAAIFLSSVALPLATFTTALALFGLAHVGSELRYVSYRFAGRLYGGLAAWILAPLCAAVLARLAATVGLLSPDADVALELACAAVMAAASAACMRQRRWLAAAVVLALGAGAVLAPFETLLCLSIAHNLTPLAFLADALDGADRRRVLALLSVPFLLLPLLIATGLPYGLLAHAGLVDPEATLFAGGSLLANMGVYVPMSLIETPWAPHLFAASVFAQCMHYGAVILVLPRLIVGNTDRPRTVAGRPGARRFALYLAAAALLLAVGFMIDFKVARQVYALAALVHSWVEIPLLLLALDRTRMATD